MRTILYDISKSGVIVFTFGHNLSLDQKYFVCDEFANKQHPADRYYNGLPKYMKKVIEDLFEFVDLDEVVQSVHVHGREVTLTLEPYPWGLDIDPVGWFSTLLRRATHQSAKFVLVSEAA